MIRFRLLFVSRELKMVLVASYKARRCFLRVFYCICDFEMRVCSTNSIKLTT